jgi:hypothetical protein
VNRVYVGVSNEVELPEGGYLFIDDEIPNIPDWKRPKIFDPLKHGFNPLKDIDYRKLVRSRTFCIRSIPKEKTPSSSYLVEAL